MRDEHGYLAVMLQPGNGEFDAWANIKAKRKFRVNIVVCETFHGPRPRDDMHAAHLDGDKRNNSASNLAWKTATENAADKIKHGTYGRKLTEDAVRQIRRERKDGARVADLAERYRVSEHNIRMIIKGAIWKHVDA
jgi:hypothetical protein